MKRNIKTQHQQLLDLVTADRESTACLEWPYNRDKDGYGKVTIGRSRFRVHVVAYCLHHGLAAPLEWGLVIRHSCDNPPCFRVNHLLLGTRKDNAQDAIQRGQMAWGERHGSVKLSAHNVALIRTILHFNPHFSRQVLADLFGVSKRNICDIVLRKTWKKLAEVNE